MCAIFGYVAKTDRPVNLKTVQAIVRENVMRGPHAFGLAWIDSKGRLRMYKQTGRVTDYMGCLAMARDAVLLVGHLRWATHGDPDQNINNHPHPADGGWLCHNGVVTNYDQLLRGPRMYPSSDCDSEVIGQLIERGSGTLRQRCVYAVEKTRGPLAILGLWSRPATMVAVRRGNPLHTGAAAEGSYFATLDEGLPGRVRSIRDNQMIVVRRREGESVMRSFDLPSSDRDPVESWCRPSLYAGG